MQMMVLWWVAACARYPLEDVPIRGATPVQRPVVRQVLVEFDEMVGRGRLELRLVSFGELKREEWAGRYRDGHIEISPDIPLESLPDILRHELCHALDDSEGWMSEEREESLDRLGEGALGELAEHAVGRRRSREVFAKLCERGPLVAQLFRTDCGVGSADLWSMLGWLDEEVWDGRPLTSVTASYEVRHSWRAPHSPSGFAINPVAEPSDIIRIWLQSDTYYYVDLYSGELRNPPSSDLSFQDLTENSFPPGMDLATWEPFGWVDGVGAALVGIGFTDSGFEDPTVGEKTWRTLLWDRGRWLHLEDGCTDPRSTVDKIFAADGRVWLGTLNGDEISWVSLYP